MQENEEEEDASPPESVVCTIFQSQQEKQKEKIAFRNSQIPDTVKKEVEEMVKKFEESDEQQFTFPTKYPKDIRAYIHEFVQAKGFLSRSRGSANMRSLTIRKRLPRKAKTKQEKAMEKAQRRLKKRKKKPAPILEKKKVEKKELPQHPTFEIAEISRDIIQNLLTYVPVSQHEVDELVAWRKRSWITRRLFNRFSVGNFTYSQMIVPPVARGNHVKLFRRQLPIYQMHSEILEKVHENQVIVIVSETGSGKTTQVPQYLLEDATNHRQPCRIICTQPRRLAAMSVADRVSYERGENLGDCVGYQIRLDSRTSPTSNLIYCTNGILVRCLMGGHYEKVFANITHVIVDEVHERDKHSDFLLISLKEALTVNPHLKIILMSATIDTQVFSSYFNNSPVISIPGRLFDVTNYYLEHVLMMTEYCKGKMVGVRGDCPRKKNTFCDEETIKLIDESLELCWTQCDEESFQQFLYLVVAEDVPIDFHHTQLGMTALMMAAARGKGDYVGMLLQMGANPNEMSQEEMKAVDWARKHHMDTCVSLLEKAASDFTQDPSGNINDISQNILQAYQSMPGADEDIDHKLLFTLIHMIHTQNAPGSILVFLAGFDAILRQNEVIQEAIIQGKLSSNVRIYMLHSNMKIHDQKTVFEPAPPGFRKIILSTNIAETSITIDDVVYVIDCGKVKQSVFDAVGGTTSLETTWISQACAKQRAGRAGRVTQGVCFRLYSLPRFAVLDKFTVPELLRVPLTEICLSAKLIAPQIAIEDFLQKALQPPAAISVGRSVELLKTMGALDNEENITDLGMHLADLPVDAHLGKMLIFSILMKCVDPILTIVSILSVRDPFIIPSSARDRGYYNQVRESLSENSFSDHMIFVRIFQRWLDASPSTSSREFLRQFCEENFLNCGAMQTIFGVRSQILMHLEKTGMIESTMRESIDGLNENSQHWPVVKACIVAGVYPNVIRREQTKRGAVLRSRNGQNFLPHPQSVIGSKKFPECMMRIKNYPSDWVIFDEKIRMMNSSYVRCNTVVSPVTVALFSGAIHINSQANLHPNPGGNDEILFKVDEDIQFSLETDTAFLLFRLRQKLNYLLLQLVQNPRTFHRITNDCESQVIQAIVQVLLQEDDNSNFPFLSLSGEFLEEEPLEDHHSFDRWHNTGDLESQNKTDNPYSWHRGKNKKRKGDWKEYLTSHKTVKRSSTITSQFQSWNQALDQIPESTEKYKVDLDVWNMTNAWEDNNNQTSWDRYHWSRNENSS
ncbi:RNA helicase [Sergentomyia squamirostris]